MGKRRSGAFLGVCCVAFADYPRFLKAFKAGKIKQLVVVSGGGRSAIRMAKNGETQVASR